MSSSLRSFFSASFGPGLTVFTACSAYFNGPLAIATTLGFAFTVVYGIVEIALMSYTPIDAIELPESSLIETATSDEAAQGNILCFHMSDTESRRAA